MTKKTVPHNFNPEDKKTEHPKHKDEAYEVKPRNVSKNTPQWNKIPPTKTRGRA